METEVQQLTTQLADSFARSSTAGTHRWLWAPSMQLLAKGEPVTAEDLAATTRRPVETVRRALSALPSVELDAHGRVIGNGITLHPTPHRFTVDGRHLYTWCALDTLMFPAVLDQVAHVQSPCPATGDPVHLTVYPDRVEDVEPAPAVVSIVIPDDVSDVRAAFCNQVHFFVSPQAAQPWLDQHPGTTVLSVQDAFAVGRQITATHVEPPTDQAATDPVPGREPLAPTAPPPPGRRY